MSVAGPYWPAMPYLCDRCAKTIKQAAAASSKVRDSLTNGTRNGGNTVIRKRVLRSVRSQVDVRIAIARAGKCECTYARQTMRHAAAVLYSASRTHVRQRTPLRKAATARCACDGRVIFQYGPREEAVVWRRAASEPDRLRRHCVDTAWHVVRGTGCQRARHPHLTAVHRYISWYTADCRTIADRVAAHAARCRHCHYAGTSQSMHSTGAHNSCVGHDGFIDGGIRATDITWRGARQETRPIARAAHMAARCGVTSATWRHRGMATGDG